MTKRLLLLVTFFVGLNKYSLADTFTAHCRDYPPEIWFDNNKCFGALPELVSDIFTELGHKIKWVKAPFARTIHDAKLGSVDLLIRHSMTKERESFLVAFPYGYFERSVFFYKAPNYKHPITSYADLAKIHVGAIRGNFYSPAFSQADLSYLMLVEETKQLVGLLDLGRVDVAITTEDHSVGLFESRFEKASFVDTFSNPLYISIPKKSPMIKHHKEVRNLLLKYRKSGAITQYFERFSLRVPVQFYMKTEQGEKALQLENSVK